MDPCKVQKQRKYSFRWSNGVYLQLKSKHPRATEIVNRIYNISERNPPEWLAIGAKRWRAYVCLVKKLSSMRYDQRNQLSDQDLRTYLERFLIPLIKESIKNNLTNV